MDNDSIGNGAINPALQQAEAATQENLLHIVLRHRWAVLGTTILSLVGAFVYILKATPIYTSASRLYVEQSGPKIIGESEGVMTRAQNYLYTQGELIRSTPIISDVVSDPQIKSLRMFTDIDNLVGYIKKKLKVTVGRRDDIIIVSFDSPYPAEAAQVVNAAVDSYIRYHSTSKRSTVSEVLKILQKEKGKRDKDLSDKFAEMVEFTRKNGVVSFDNKGGNIVFERLVALSSALTEAELATLNAKANFEAAQSLADKPVKIRQFAAASAQAGGHLFMDDREAELKSELNKVEMELKTAKYFCTEDHPSIRAMHTKIDHTKQELDGQAKEFAQAYVEVMQLRWIAAKQRQDELQASFDSQIAAARELGVKTAEYAVLQSELKRAERICEIIDDRIKELNVTEDVGALNITTLEVARASTAPSRPQKARIMAMALALGLAFGGCLALLRDWMDYRLHSSEEVSAVLGVPVLGVVPSISEGQKIIATQGQKILLKLTSIFDKMRRGTRVEKPPATAEPRVRHGRQKILALAETYRASRADTLYRALERGSRAAGVPSASHGGSDKTSERFSFVARGQNVRLKPKSVVAEAYRTIRTAVFFSAPKGEAKIILVTSPEQRDGKSTLVSNLAIAMAQAGQRTLVLDGDFRRPTQHKIFEIDNKTGLANVIAGTVRLDEAVQQGPIAALDILPCGPEVPNPSEILNSDTFAQILKNLSKCYDRIIVDSPPVMPVADSQILAAICDVTLLVLRADKSTRRHSRYAKDCLMSVGAHVLGAVINDVSHKHGQYGYYSRYGRYGGYHRYYGYYGEKAEKTG